nr:unnamed protein product [Callosobruchus chinensis]
MSMGGGSPPEEFVPQGQTVHAAYCVDVLQRLRKRVVRMRKDFSATWILYHDNVPCHNALRVHERLAKHKAKALKGTHFTSIEEIQSVETKVLRELHKDAFQSGYCSWKRRRKKCVKAQERRGSGLAMRKFVEAGLGNDNIHELDKDTTSPSKSKGAALAGEKDLEAITDWGLRGRIQCVQDAVLYAIKQEVPKLALGSSEQPGSAKKSLKLLGVSITENMIWHEHVSSIATASGKKLGYLFRSRKYFSPSNLLTLYKAQMRLSLEYCSHI